MRTLPEAITPDLWDGKPHPAEVRDMPNLWTMAETFRPYMRDNEARIERPEPVKQQCMTLTASLYPDCPLCRRDMNGCACDPDDYAEAVWAQAQARKGGVL